MPKLSAKQLRFNSPGDIIAANSDGIGSIISKGNNNTVLFSTSTGVAYQYISSLTDSSLGISLLSVNNNITALDNEGLKITNGSNVVNIQASSNTSSTLVDIQLLPQSGGKIVIGTSSTLQSIIQASGSNDLVLSAGTLGFVTAPAGYSITSLAPSETFATIGYLDDQINANELVEYRDSTTLTLAQVNFAFTLSYTAIGDVAVLFNGLELIESGFTFGSNVVTLIDSVIGYTTQSGDILEYRYDTYSSYPSFSFSGSISNSAIPSLVSQLVNDSGYITGTTITSSMIDAVLGFTPYNSSNPAGYITNSAIPNIPSTTSQLVNNSGFLTFAPVLSVNGFIGNVSLSTSSLTDVALSGVTLGQVLTWNGTKWINETPSTGTSSVSTLSQLNDVTITSSIAGQALIFNGSKWTNTSLPTTPTATSQLINNSGFINGTTVTNSMVTSALGYTPYNSSNPAGYLTSIPAQPYDVIMSYIGNPTGGQILYRAVIPRVVTFPASLSGSYVLCSSAPANNWTANILLNSSVIGSATILSGSLMGTFSFVNTVVTAAGSILEIDAPGSADTTLTNPSITMVGSR